MANLIGKFETQTKRLSLSASSPSRSSSVVSHVTGDSAKEEVKERREWPPRSTTESAQKQFPIVPSLYSRNPPPPLITSSLSNPPAAAGDNMKLDASIAEVGEVEVPLTAKALNASQRQAKAGPNTFLENWRKDLPPPSVPDVVEPSVPETAKPDLAAEASAPTPTLATAKKLAPPSTPRTSSATSKATATRAPALSKSTASLAPRTPVKSVLKSSSSRQSLASPALQPLKPQHTGQSVASNATTKRSVAKPPPTPSVPKTPARSEAAARSKTPTASRPKTPSTGLFAPTAASLAKSRNAVPPAPTPVKKAHLSSNSIDRLSKPTAASQARMAAAAANAPRPAVAAPRVAASKSKTAPAASKPRKDATASRAAAATAGAVAAVATGLATVTVEEQVSAQAEVEGNGESTENTQPAEVLDTEVEVANGAAEEVEADAKGADQVEVEEGRHSVEEQESAPRSPEIEAALEPEATDRECTADTPVEHDSKDDLEDIVNLLQSVTITKPPVDTPADIPDDILEIPDEEEK